MSNISFFASSRVEISRRHEASLNRTVFKFRCVLGCEGMTKISRTEREMRERIMSNEEWKNTNILLRSGGWWSRKRERSVIFDGIDCRARCDGCSEAERGETWLKFSDIGSWDCWCKSSRVARCSCLFLYFVSTCNYKSKYWSVWKVNRANVAFSHFAIGVKVWTKQYRVHFTRMDDITVQTAVVYLAYIRWEEKHVLLRLAVHTFPHFFFFPIHRRKL